MENTAAPNDPELQDHLQNSLYKVMTEKNEKVLRKILHWGTPRRQPDQSFSSYLATVKDISNLRRRGFTKSQRMKMVDDPGDLTFDVTLLHLCIQHGCDGLAPARDRRWFEQAGCLEYNITSIKNFRNEFIHKEYEVNENTFLDKIESLRSLLNDTITEATSVFHVDDLERDNFLREINEELSNIRDQPLDTTGHTLVHDRIKELVKMEGKREIKKRYKKQMTIINPVSNIIGKELFINIKTVYCKLNIKPENVEDAELLDIENLLEYADAQLTISNKNNSAILLEGSAGAGKTTLTRKMLSDWATGVSNIKKLDEYEFAIWTECRDRRTRSLDQLLHLLMSNVGTKIQSEGRIVKCIQENSLLFIIDGFDEINEASERVLNDILALGENDDITVICTTRPNKVPDFKRIVPNTFNILHVKMIGIAEEDREQFVKNYSLALGREIRNIDISGLLLHLKTGASHLLEHLRLPFNLVLLTILWIYEPDNPVTTATELFQQTHELCQIRLIERLPKWGQAGPEQVRKFIKRLAEEAFISHSADNAVLSTSSVQRLKEICTHLNLPHEEVLGAFLIQKTSLTDDERENFSFPHKGIQDFFSALHVEDALLSSMTGLNVPGILSSFKTILLEKGVPSDIIQDIVRGNHDLLNRINKDKFGRSATIRKVFQEILKDTAMYIPNQDQVQLDLRKWRNVLTHLTGLLYHRGGFVTEERAAELVRLLTESGITDTGEWFDFVSSVKCDVTISKHIVLKGEITLHDWWVEPFWKHLMENAEPKKVILDLYTDPGEIPRLKDFLEALQETSWEAWMWFRHDFRVPKEGGSAIDRSLQEFLEKSKVKVKGIMGQLSAPVLLALPSWCLWYLYLSVKDGDHFRSVIPVLTSIKKRLPKLDRLDVHLPTDIDEELLQPLPQVKELALRLANVEEASVEKASRIVKACQPSGGRYWRLILAGIMRDNGTYDRFLEELCRQSVKVTDLLLTSPAVDLEEQKRLESLTRTKLGCRFKVIRDEQIWY